ncbi:MAG: C40 family peptidase [Nitrospiria bacterium]
MTTIDLRFMTAAAIAFMVFSAACSTTSLRVDDQAAPQTLDYDALIAAPSKPPSSVRARLVQVAQSYEHEAARPTHLPKKFDCTAFVFSVYREAAQISLPRRAHDQVQIGDPIAPVELQQGDLIYFTVPGTRFLHVGLYVGDGRFIHAPGSHGLVQTESLGTEIWRARFMGARRILPLS